MRTHRQALQTRTPGVNFSPMPLLYTVGSTSQLPLLTRLGSLGPAIGGFRGVIRLLGGRDNWCNGREGTAAGTCIRIALAQAWKRWNAQNAQPWKRGGVSSVRKTAQVRSSQHVHDWRGEGGAILCNIYYFSTNIVLFSFCATLVWLTYYLFFFLAVSLLICSLRDVCLAQRCF